MTNNSQFEQALQRDLQSMEAHSDAQDVFALAQARNQALAQSRNPSRKLLWPAMGASLASVSIAALLISGPSWQLFNSTEGNGLLTEPDNSMLISDFDTDAIELYEDLDFYYWLADADIEGGS
jgi:hypothetical protein